MAVARRPLKNARMPGTLIITFLIVKIKCTQNSFVKLRNNRKNIADHLRHSMKTVI